MAYFEIKVWQRYGIATLLKGKWKKMSGLARYIYDLSDKRLAKDVATDKQKWAVEICEQYATDKSFDWEHGTMLEMQRFLDKYFETAKDYYDEWMQCWLSLDDCW